MKQLHILKEIQGKQAFHSALLTCYSLDFYFLEQRMISTLRKKGIRNIAVVADARMVEDSISKLACNIKKASSLYSLSTVLTNGAFHPKIYLLVGSKTVAMVLGSGNITSGGFGKNHELFTYLYADDKNKEYMPLISQAWGYLKNVCSEFRGITKSQLDWMEEHCELAIGDNGAGLPKGFTNVSADMAISFLNSDSGPIASQLLHLIESKESMTRITVLSPYFDENGSFLRLLHERFPNAIIDVVVQPDQALLPTKMSSTERIRLFSWNDTKIGKDKSLSPERFVHAKMLHFTSGETEYLVLGSANATNRAFMQDSKANSEAVLVYKGQGKKWLEEIGIIGLTKSIPLPAKSMVERRKNTLEEGKSFRYKIQNIDLKGTQYVIYMKDVPPSDSFLVFYTSDGQILKTVKDLRMENGVGKGIFEKSVNLRSVAYACFCRNSLQISNKQIVNDEYALWSNNPSPENRKILYLLDRISEDSYSTLDIYDFYDVLNGEVRQTKRGSAANSEPAVEELKHSGKSYLEVLESVEDGTYTPGNETPGRVFSTYLDRLSKELTLREGEDIDDEEDGDINTGNRREQKESKTIVFNSLKAFEREKAKISKFHERYADYLLTYDNDDYEVGLTDYAMFLLCISHLINNAEKRYSYLGDENGEVLVPYVGPVHEYTSFNAIAINIIGKFLTFLDYYKKEKTYPNEYDLTRLKYFKKLAFGKILISLAILHEKCPRYRKQFEKWHLLIMLNCVHKFDLSDFDIAIDVQKQIRLFNVQNLSVDCAIEYLNNLITMAKNEYGLIIGRSIYENINNGKIIYVEDIGFCHVEKQMPGSGIPKSIKMSTPGFEFDTNEFTGNWVYNIEKKCLFETIQSQ